MRYDRIATNKEIAERLNAVRQQINLIYEEVSFLAAMVAVETPDNQFKQVNVQDRVTTLTIAVRNNAAEMDKLWKLTRQ